MANSFSQVGHLYFPINNIYLEQYYCLFMTYCVYEDLIGFDEVKIHLQSCRHYVDHEPTETTKWHEVDDYKAAEILAEQISKKYNKGWKRAECCS